jgi:peptidyl-dipeptidase A
MEKPLQEFIKTLQGKFEALETPKNAAFFDASVSGEAKYFQKYEALELEHARLLAQQDSFQFLSEARDPDAIRDPLLRRQARILYLVHLPHQVPERLTGEMIRLETMVEQKFTMFRAEVNGRRMTDNQVEALLETSTDSREVQQAWEASKEVGRLVEADVLQLVKLRNEAARLLGYDNYHQMSLMLSEQDPQEVATLFDTLDGLTRKAFMQEKQAIDDFLAGKFNLSPEQLRPWHYQDRFFQEVPKIYQVDLDRFYEGRDLEALTRIYFAGIGMDISTLLQRSDLYEKPGKNQHAFCINIDRKQDIRVLCNIRPSQRWMNTMLHEFGHAVYELFYDARLPFFLREPAHTFTTEAVAMFFGRLTGNPAWMHAMGLMDAGEASRLAPELKKMQTTAQLVFSRWAQVMFRFEKALYEDPGQDLNALWWELVSRYQGLTPPANTNYPHWASKIHVATAPCYYHNYLLGELLASQFHHSITSRILQAPMEPDLAFHGNTAIGDFFKERVFAPGASLSWEKMIQQATGEPLNPAWYAAQFVPGHQV